MSGLKKTPEEIYNHFKKNKNTKYIEVEHCQLLIKVMQDPYKGTIGSFCVEAMITDRTFLNWVREHELFRNVYIFGKLLSRELWEEEGRRIKDREYPLGVVDYTFEHWKMVGWCRYGVNARNSKIKINVTPNGTPIQHYREILEQAAEGDFTASEFKQLMESINVGLNTHEKLELQKQIDDLKADLKTMRENADVKNPFANK